MHFALWKSSKVENLFFAFILLLFCFTYLFIIIMVWSFVILKFEGITPNSIIIRIVRRLWTSLLSHKVLRIHLPHVNLQLVGRTASEDGMLEGLVWANPFFGVIIKHELDDICKGTVRLVRLQVSRKGLASGNDGPA